MCARHEWEVNARGMAMATSWSRWSLAASPTRRFDLVLCRNLAFTYFGSDLARAALSRVTQRLHPGGALVIGLHERLPAHVDGRRWGRYEPHGPPL